MNPAHFSNTVSVTPLFTESRCARIKARIDCQIAVISVIEQESCSVRAEGKVAQKGLLGL